MEGVAAKQALVDRYNEIAANYSDETADEMARLQDEIEAQGLWDLDTQVDQAMDALRCPDGDADVNKLSGGEKRRVALCKLLLDAPDILLLDEPTNHLDAESVAWLEHTLREYKGSVILVTHDRYFLDNVTGWILELDRGRGIPHEGNYSSFLEVQEKRLLQEGGSEEARERTIAREREWIQQSRAPARPNPRRASMPMKNCWPNRRNSAGAPRRSSFPRAAAGLSGGRGRKPDQGLWRPAAVRECEFQPAARRHRRRHRPQRRGQDHPVPHAHRSGKARCGTLRVGDTVVIGYVDQSRDTLDPNKNVWEEISGGTDMLELGKRTMQSRAYVGAFNFKGGDQQKKVGQLSGGERNRVHLAKMLKSGANLLLLDEPTNDLDVDTLRALEAALEDFAGCAMIISHDRWFLDRIATHMLAFEGDSHVEWFEGNYQDYEADKRRLGIDADQPHRIKYKRFARA